MIQSVKQLVTVEYGRFIRFCLVGASGIPVNLVFAWLGSAVLYRSLDLIYRNALASLTGIVVATFTNFLLDDLWTWRDKRQGRFVGRMARFYLVSSVASGIQWGVAVALSSVVLRMRIELAQLIGIGVATGVNFLLNHVWTYRQRRVREVVAAASSPPPQE